MFADSFFPFVQSSPSIPRKALKYRYNVEIRNVQADSVPDRALAARMTLSIAILGLLNCPSAHILAGAAWPESDPVPPELQHTVVMITKDSP